MRAGVKARWLLLMALCIGVRCMGLNADAPRFLTWSSAQDTDEGFYTLDARHRVLFGTDAPGDFHDRTLAPLLSWAQEGWYRLFGAGIDAARGLDVVCGLACIGLLCWGLGRSQGKRSAWWGALLLGLCVPFALYNRLALQETPAALLLTASWALWTEARQGGRHGAAVVAGAVLALSVAVKMLCVLVLPVAVALVWKERRRGLWFALGLTVTLALLFAVWVWPAHMELLRFGAYYRSAQASAGGAGHVLWNVRRFWIGDAMGVRRGLVPYLLLFCPALVWWVAAAVWRRGGDPFLWTWAVCGLGYCAVSSYAPDRYYVLFYPALAALAAGEAARLIRKAQFLGMGLVLIPAALWLGAGALHPTFRRQQAADMLARTLSPGACVVGDAAPALCLGTQLRAAPVQFGLSNAADPLAQTGAAYVVTGREPAWRKFWAGAEPDAVVPAHKTVIVTLASGRIVDVFRAR